ncbi:MAG TPA: gamma-glutamylcyclotransferase family protein [Kiloniellaceae bacterium]
MMNEAVSDDVDRDKLTAALDQVNRARLGLRTGDDPAAIERDIEDMYRPSVKLAIYGTLAPGKVNHHHIAGLGGAWQDAAVRGSLGRVPCGIHEGLPAMLLDPASPLQPLKLLTCEGLPAAWPRLDAFEGEEMQRLLVPLEREGGITGVANIYALRRAMVEALG